MPFTTSPHFRPPSLRRRFALGMLCVTIFSLHAWAGPLDVVVGLFSSKIDAIDATVRHGRWDAYLSGYAWHVPWAYSEATRGRLNESTWGGGVGRSIRDGDGDRHSVFFMSFLDSHREPQFIASYGWQRYKRVSRDFSLGYGYMAFLFSREDVVNYLPIPAALPCVSIRFRKWEAIGLYVPRVSKDIKGDVLYVFMRVAL